MVLLLTMFCGVFLGGYGIDNLFVCFCFLVICGWCSIDLGGGENSS